MQGLRERIVMPAGLNSPQTEKYRYENIAISTNPLFTNQKTFGISCISRSKYTGTLLPASGGTLASFLPQKGRGYPANGRRAVHSTHWRDGRHIFFIISLNIVVDASTRLHQGRHLTVGAGGGVVPEQGLFSQHAPRYNSR